MENKPAVIDMMIEVLTDTVRFYSENPDKNRAISHGDCLYLIPETGAKCALGRLLNETDLKYLEETEQLGETAIIDIIGELTTEKVLKLPIRFLEDLQNFHDNDENWTETGMRPQGETAADKILEKINSRVYA